RPSKRRRTVVTMIIAHDDRTEVRNGICVTVIEVVRQLQMSEAVQRSSAHSVLIRICNIRTIVLAIGNTIAIIVDVRNAAATRAWLGLARVLRTAVAGVWHTIAVVVRIALIRNAVRIAVIGNRWNRKVDIVDPVLVVE